jgi:SAM-dependent methyltransferase
VDRPGYTIEGGRADADRLARQARVMASATAAFLSRVGVDTSWHCLDVGCGDGQVTLELARAVGPPGRVVGIDADEDALPGPHPSGLAPQTPLSGPRFDVAPGRFGETAGGDHFRPAAPLSVSTSVAAVSGTLKTGHHPLTLR